MLSCVGDIDVMIRDSSQLAIPAGTAPPTHLPAEFHSRVRVFDIVDSGFPGYVYLMSSYVLTECNDDGDYNAVQCSRSYKTNPNPPSGRRHGPALVVAVASQSQIESPFRHISESDGVPCMHCLTWPPQAADWPSRHRNSGWPDSATVDRVVSNGCDVVQVAHRQCRQDEWMSQYQWRLSFSRAEVVLMNSWMRVQQIVYHMLRHFMKTQELLKGLRDINDPRDNTKPTIISNYNIKTLMLWACELKPRSWWTVDVNVIRICVELLHNLAGWLTDARCQHYFINNCNLLDSLDNADITNRAEHAVNELMSITESWFAEWFVQNYIQECARCCDDFVSQLFDNVCVITDLHEAVSEVVQWRLDSMQMLSWSYFTVAQLVIIRPRSVYIHSLSLQLCSFWMTELPKLDRDLSHYFTAIAFLHAVYKTTIKSLEDELLDVLATICLQSNDLRRCRNARCSSVLSLSQAAMLMKVVANNSRSTVQLIQIELSKAYLYRALRCKYSDSDYIYCLANVYLAVLYYTTGQYQTAIDHCTLVTRSRDHSQCGSHVVRGELLTQIDNEIDSLLGLAVFYQHVRTAALSLQQRTQHVGDFSAELFAHYLSVRCLSITRCRQLTPTSLTDEIQRYRNCFFESSDAFITDVLAFKSVRGTEYSVQFRNQMFLKDQTKPVTSGQLDTSELVELLKRSAVEHLTTCRQFEKQKFHEIAAVIVTTDYEALYAYECGEYLRCLQLSVDNVRTLVGGLHLMPYVHAFPELIQLMDDDIVSLTGLMLIVNPSCREQYTHVSISQLSLSLYLMTQCQMKLRHSMTSLDETLPHTLGFIEEARINVEEGDTLDQLLLKLTEQKILKYLSAGSDNLHR